MTFAHRVKSFTMLSELFVPNVQLPLKVGAFRPAKRRISLP